MNFGKSSNCVHWLYATRTGTATLIDSSELGHRCHPPGCGTALTSALTGLYQRVATGPPSAAARFSGPIASAFQLPVAAVCVSCRHRPTRLAVARLLQATLEQVRLDCLTEPPAGTRKVRTSKGPIWAPNEPPHAGNRTRAVAGPVVSQPITMSSPSSACLTAPTMTRSGSTETNDAVRPRGPASSNSTSTVGRWFSSSAPRVRPPSCQSPRCGTSHRVKR